MIIKLKQYAMRYGKKLRVNKEYGTPDNNDIWSYPDDDSIEYDNLLDLRLWKDKKGRKVLSVYVAGNTNDPVVHYHVNRLEMLDD